jgi:UDP-N-acetylglucosamine 1-carboxyvinyltransferase
MGANIKGAGTDVIKIKGVNQLNGGTYSVTPDYIEAGTYMLMAAGTGGNVLVKDVIPKHLESITAKLKEIGAVVNEFDDSIQVISTGRLSNARVKTLPYPGFPTDLQPLITTLLSVSEGTSIVTEAVWESRFKYVDELRRMGANITVEKSVAVIEGIDCLSGCPVQSHDLRAGAAMVMAGLMANGTTEVTELKYIDRGYEDLEAKLTALGADIVRIEDKNPTTIQKAN